MGVCEFKSAGDWFLYVAKQRSIIRHIQQKSETIDLATVNLLTENVEMKKKLELSIVYRSTAYLLNEPLQDWLFFCEDREVLSQTRYTKELKKYIDDIFRDKIGFYRTGKCVIVYSQNVNPCQYSMSTVKGFGLRADNITKHFANLIKRDIP